MNPLTLILQSSFKDNMEFIKEFFQFLLSRKKYWLAPVFLTLLLLGLIIVFSSGTAVAPFIYTLF